MSVQFGTWSFEGPPPSAEYIDKVNATLAPYGPDSNESYSKDGVRILYRSFCTTKESRGETQPYVIASGAVLTWDGRLDNRAELISELYELVKLTSTDVEIVAAAFERWSDRCLGKLIGDWALSLWNPHDRFVLLAKDPIGTKHLYYSFDDERLTWSTILDPLVLFAGKTFELCEEYVAGWLAIPVFPATHLTPYIGIHSVPPSSFVLLRPGKRTVAKYWDFNPGARIRYRTDAEYEEHFRSVLSTSVKRRLRSDRPVLAELSGGMDSSSIVCVADIVIAGNAAECPRLDTISWFDDSYDHIEPDSNELHWISKVENKRGRVGFHINTGALRRAETKGTNSRISFESEFDNGRFAATPVPNRQSEFFNQCRAYVQLQGYRVTFSGIGGDDPTGGGVPTPTPELQDLLTRARFTTFTKQLNAWAEKMGKSPLTLIWEAIQGFLAARVDLPPAAVTPSWLCAGFVRRNRATLCGYPFRLKLFGPLPSFQDHIDKLEANRRFVAHLGLHPELVREVRYSYYDRDFLEFMFAIPREQVVRPGQRRSLMKRALVGVIPIELLNRRRKAFIPPEKDRGDWPRSVGMEQCIFSSSQGIIDIDRFAKSLQETQHDRDIPVACLRRALTWFSWLRHITNYGILATSNKQFYSATVGASTHPNGLAS